MKIRVLSGNKVFAGKPSEIVHQMRDLDFESSDSVLGYLIMCSKRSEVLGKNLGFSGRNEEELCLTFIASMVKNGLAGVE